MTVREQRSVWIVDFECCGGHSSLSAKPFSSCSVVGNVRGSCTSVTGSQIGKTRNSRA